MAEDKIGADQGKYPAGQAPRPAPNGEIKAEVFREREVMQKNDPKNTRSGPKKPSN